MLKTRKKWISLLVVLVLLLGFLPAGMASAATTYSATGAPTVKPPGTYNLGSLVIKIEPWAGGPASALISLPSNFVIPDSEDTENEAIIPSLETPSVSLVVYRDGFGENEFRVNLAGGTPREKLTWVIDLKNIEVPSSASGDITLTIDGLAGQLPSGSVVVGKASKGEVTVSVVEVQNITETGTVGTGQPVQFTIKENTAGALKDGDSVKLTLPPGFTWADVGTATVLAGSGFSSATALANNNRALVLQISTTGTRSKAIIRLEGDIVVDETKARYGDVEVAVGGASSVSPSSLVVAKYVEYGVKAYAENATEVLAGRLDQQIGDIVIEEQAPGTLVVGRSIVLTLPANAKWANIDNLDIGTEDTEGLDGPVFLGTDGRKMKFTVASPSTNEPGKITISGLEVNLAVDVAGDLKITVSGSAGVAGELVVAKVKAPVTATAAGKDDVKIGLPDQKASDITITESQKEALIDGKKLTVSLPEGIKFSATPKVEVTAGDLDIDELNVRKDGGVLTIPVSSQGTKASTIKISDIQYTIDRTVPEGDVGVSIGGDAVDQVNDRDALEDWADDHTNEYTITGDNLEVDIDGDGTNEYVVDLDDGMFPKATTAAKAVNASCVTPAPPEQKVTAVFKVGDTKYTLNNVEYTMDVVPFIEDGRTYIAVRYAAYAVGVPEDAILWDAATRTATFIKGDRVVQLTADSNRMLVNGAIITMDVPAKVVGGRMVVPIRWVGIAFGCTVDWDAATQTVTITR